MSGSDFASGFETACGLSSTDGKRALAPCASFLKDATDTYAAEQMLRKDNSMKYAAMNMRQAMDADINARVSQIRNSDLMTNATFFGNYINSQANGYTHDVDITKRQFEINEYHYYNKLDTLFFLQVFFIAVLTMAVLLYFNRRGTLTTQMTGLLTALLAVILVIVGVSRYFYTTRTRDRRLWHRRYFQTEKDPRPDLISDRCPGAPSTTINLNALFDTSTIDCAKDTLDARDEWLKQAETEAKNQMLGGVSAASIFASSGPGIPERCKRR